MRIARFAIYRVSNFNFPLRKHISSRSLSTLQNINKNKPFHINWRSYGTHSNFYKAKGPLTLKLISGIGIGSFIGCLLVAKNSYIVAAQSDSIPQFKIARSIKQPADNTGLKLTLYQYQNCPFCCKVRAYLDYHGFSYDVVEVNSVLRTQVKWSKYKKVPILICRKDEDSEHVQLNDSSVIMSALETFLVDPSKPVEQILGFFPALESKNERGKLVTEYPNKYFVMYGEKNDLKTTDKDRKEERKWRKWVDDVLVHTLSPNIYRTPTEALQAFNYFSTVGDWENNFSTPMRYFVIYVGASAMFVIGKLLKRRYSLKDDVRQSLYDACNEWTKNIARKDRTYLGGEEPNLADLSVYGVLNAIEGCDAFNELLLNSNINDWYFKMKYVVTRHAGGPPLSKRH